MGTSPRSLRRVALALLCTHAQSFLVPRYSKNSRGLDLRSRLATSRLHGTAFPGELQPLTVPALKELCRARGLKVGGTKADLIARLESSDAGGTNELPFESELTLGAAAADSVDARFEAPDGVTAVEAAPPSTTPFPSGSSEHSYIRGGDIMQAVSLDADLLHDLISTREV